MKRAIILTMAVLSASLVEAQTAKDIERAGFVRDSLADVLAEHRANYAKNESLREKLTPTILALESELCRAQSEYDKVVEAVGRKDIEQALADYAQAQTQKGDKSDSATPKIATADEYKPDPTRLKCDLVKNDYFVERLSESDYKTLLDAQQREVKTKEAVALYMKMYGELLALQRKYMEVATREEADAIAKRFAVKEGEMAQQDEAIKSMSGSFYYNKMYAYDLLMERGGKTAMLDLSADVSARAEREINENSDLYQSDALVNYYARKKAMTEYEMQLASLLSLTSSRDSLKLISAELKNRDYRLSKLSLQRRSFINYEDIEVKKPTIYTSKNPVPKTKVYDYGVIYRIRVGLFTNKPNISALRGVVPLSYSEAYHKGMYAYYVGGFRTEQEAKDGVAYLKKLGFRDPIIAVWVDGEYYPTIEEMHRSQSQYNIEISGVVTLTDEMKSKILSHKSDCTISRIGTTFVVGTFEGKSVAQAVVADLQAMSKDISVKITKKP